MGHRRVFCNGWWPRRVGHNACVNDIRLTILRIYVVRLLLVAYYNFRSSKYQSQLDRLQKQRESTIDRLKAATKYNSTQELLRKYGGEPHTKEKQTSSAKTSKPSNSQRAMTGFLPPPTANIPGRNAAPLLQEDTKTELSIPSAVAAEKTSPPGSPYGNMPSSATSAEFAPNAFASAPQYTQEQEGPRWYDRILDVLLGDDETLPRNRLALICRKCRLVNGQAPPGTTSLEDLGRWRCISCGATNGQESEVGRMLPNVRPSTISGFESSNPEKDSSKGPSFAQRAKKTESVSDQETSDVTQYSGASDASESGESESANVRLPVNQAESTPRRRSARIREMSEEP